MIKVKKMFLISGPIGPVIGSNQSFKNTLIEYLKSGYEVYHFAFFYRNSQKYNVKDFLKFKNYHFYGTPKVFEYIRNLISKKSTKKEISIPIPHPDAIIKPESEITTFQSIFFIFYTIFESIRALLLALFIKPDLVYSYEVFSVIPGYLIKKIFKIPAAKRFQGTYLDYNNLNNKKLWFHKLAYKLKFNLVIMANDGTKGNKVLKKLGINKYLFLLNGLDDKIKEKVDEEKIKYLKEKHNLKEHYVLGIFNRFHPFKRIDRAIYLLKQTIDNGINAKLLIGGMGGPMEDSLKKYAKELNVEKKIIWLGKIKYEEMKYYYKLCDVVLIVNDYANTGNQILEVSYLGIPTIATDDENNSKYLSFNNIYYVKPKEFSKNAIKGILYFYNNKNKFNKNELKSWKERMEIEIKEIEKILEEKNENTKFNRSKTTIYKRSSNK
ncbi:glycosyltransferase family 4 protein [Marinitoga aeolica]|uniref:Glycosyltransferase family 4 protein n=1 Tax=Marinitoga aeolica TaxID=2809031 RepID=A0ABY8PTT0_9BACT|nr:glycosyltransferase family 4 protein [Marinitoga aeolica]WGS66027.1 glycosyltransferase family 4 protein [Marinitoga aeolica]